MKMFNQLIGDIKTLGSTRSINMVITNESIDCLAMISKKKLDLLNSAVHNTKKGLTIGDLLKIIACFLLSVVIIATGIYINSYFITGFGGTAIIICCIFIYRVFLRFIYFYVPKSRPFLNKHNGVSVGVKSLSQLEFLVGKEVLRRNPIIKNKEI